MDDAEAVVRAYIAACNDGYGPRVVELLHPDVQMHENRELPGAVSAVRDGKLLRQDAFGDREEAEAFFRRD